MQCNYLICPELYPDRRIFRKIGDAQLNQVPSTPRIINQLRDWSIVRLLILGLALVSTTIVATIVTRLLVPPAPSSLHQWVLLKNLLLPLVLLAVYAWTVRVQEQRRPSELAGTPGVGLFAVGFVGGIAVMSTFILILSMAGAARVTSGVASGGLLQLCNEILVPWLTAVGEELLFRAVLFRITEEMFGTAAAILISAGLFALSHAVNPGANVFTLAMLALGMGCLLALSYAATRNLWLPIGLHMGWNIAEGFLYGLPNSGMTDPLQVLRTTISGPTVLTGGDFGPEGSVVLPALCILVSAILLWITLHSRLWLALRFQLCVPRSSV